MGNIRLGVRNDAVGLQHVGHLRGQIGAVEPDLRIELCPVQPIVGSERPNGPGSRQAGSDELLRGLESGQLDAVWLDLRYLPRQMPESIVAAACFPRRNPREALVHRLGTSFAQLPDGSVLATTSAVTRAQVARIRPDVSWVTLAGDLPIRLHKLHLQHADGVIEPASDLLILGFGAQAVNFLSTDTALPQPGQGTWAVCCRSDRRDVMDLVAPLDDSKARLCATAEREFAAALNLAEGASAAVWARAQRAKLMLDACVADSARNTVTRLTISGPTAQQADLVQTLALMFRQQGGRATRTGTRR